MTYADEDDEAPEAGAHDLDDGAHEVVDIHPARGRLVSASIEEAVATAAGGRMAALHAKSAPHRTDFLILRSPTGAAKIALAHVPVFSAIWKAWAAKRVTGAADPGVSPTDIAEAADLEVSEVRTVIVSLLRNGLIRVATTHVGMRGARSLYYPSQAGVQALAFAEVLGPGSFVQVGRTNKAWTSRNHDEPGNIFQHAALLRGGAEPVFTDPEFA